MNETTSMPHGFGTHDGGTRRTPSFDCAGTGPFELRVYGEAWREGLRFRRDASGGGPDRRSRARSPGFAELLRMSSEMDDDNTGFEESASREGCPPSATRIAAALLLARAFDASPAAARDLVSGGAPVVVDVADGAVLDALKGEWRGMFFDDPSRLIDLIRTAPGRRSALDGAYVMLKEPLKGAAKERLERVATDMCGYALPFVAFSPDGRACLPKVVNEAARHRMEVPMLDPATVLRTIRAVTGVRTAVDLPAETVRDLTVGDLAAAVRFDRTPEACVDELRRLAALKRAESPSRDPWHGRGARLGRRCDRRSKIMEAQRDILGRSLERGDARRAAGRRQDPVRRILRAERSWRGFEIRHPANRLLVLFLAGGGAPRGFPGGYAPRLRLRPRERALCDSA
jgi:hypothetical protein